MRLTKKTIFTLLLPLLLAAPLFSANAREGGIGDGGGNAKGSTPAEVEHALKETKNHLSFYVHSAAGDATHLLNPVMVKDKRAKKVLEAWLVMEDGVEAFVKNSFRTIFKPQTAPCPADAQERDASTAHERGAPICFSTTRLSRFPTWILPAELVSLAAHEFAHHFGFDEQDADAIQTYIFNSFGLLQIQASAQKFMRSDLGNYRERVRSYSPKGSPAEQAFARSLCREFFLIEGQAIAYNIEAFKRHASLKPACDAMNFDPDALEKRLRELLATAIKEIK